MFANDIKKLTQENTNFRKVVSTGKNAQLVLMCILPGEDIGKEVHPTTDQILFFVEGSGRAVLNDEEQEVHENEVVFVPAGTTHNFINTDTKNLQLYTVYAPPAHKDGTIHKTKEEAEKEEKY